MNDEAALNLLRLRPLGPVETFPLSADVEGPKCDRRVQAFLLALPRACLDHALLEHLLQQARTALWQSASLQRRMQLDILPL